MSVIKTCVLGVGLSGLTFHIPFILALPDIFQLTAVLERSPTSPGGRVKERFGVDVKIYNTFDDVLADNDIELVIVGTPNATHYEYVKQCLQAGKHVLVEKPAVPTVAEAQELGKLAAAKTLFSTFIRTVAGTPTFWHSNDCSVSHPLRLLILDI